MQGSTRMPVMGVDRVGGAFVPDALGDGARADMCASAKWATGSGKTPRRAVLDTSKVSCANRRAHASAGRKVMPCAGDSTAHRNGLHGDTGKIRGPLFLRWHRLRAKHNEVFSGGHQRGWRRKVGVFAMTEVHLRQHKSACLLGEPHAEITDDITMALVVNAKFAGLDVDDAVTGKLIRLSTTQGRKRSGWRSI